MKAWITTPEYPAGKDGKPIPGDSMIFIRYRCGLEVGPIRADSRSWGWARKGFRPMDSHDIVAARPA